MSPVYLDIVKTKVGDSELPSKNTDQTTTSNISSDFRVGTRVPMSVRVILLLFIYTLLIMCLVFGLCLGEHLWTVLRAHPTDNDIMESPLFIRIGRTDSFLHLLGTNFYHL